MTDVIFGQSSSNFLILYFQNFFSIYIKQYYFQVMKYYIRLNPSNIEPDQAHVSSDWVNTSQS